MTPNPPKSVLIVEDQQLVRAGMKLMLHMAEPRCVIFEAGSHDMALELLAERAFDLVFLDIDLGTATTGLDTLAHIRSQNMELKVIMLSGSDDPETVLRCVAAGASGFITKGHGNETVFQRALATVFADSVFLPASVIGGGGPKPLRPAEPCTAGELGLSPRLCEVLYYLCQGLPNKSIANRMGISEGTVRRDYVSHLLKFFSVARRTELIVEVARRGVRVLPPQSQPA